MRRLDVSGHIDERRRRGGGEEENM